MFDDLPYGAPPSMAIAPVSLAGAAAATLWANVRDVNDFLGLFFFLGIGTAAEDITITLTQATSSAGAGAKALVVKEAWYKTGGPAFTAATAAATDKFVKSTLFTRESSAATYITTTDRVAVTNQFMGLIRISPKDLDLAGGFKYAKASFSASTAAQLMYAHWLPMGNAYSGKTLPSLLV